MEINFDISKQEMLRMTRQVQAWQLKKREKIGVLIEDTTNAIAEDARVRVPVRTGLLKSHIKTDLERITNELVAYVYTKAPPAYHAHLIELGTARSRAYPFLQPAAEAHITGYLTRLSRILQES